MATTQVMDWKDQSSIRSSKMAAEVLKHNGKLRGQSRPVVLDELIQKAIEAGWLVPCD